MRKLKISQSQQIKKCEERRIEIEIEINNHENWEIIAKDTIRKINNILHPEDKGCLTTYELNELLKQIKVTEMGDLKEIKEAIKKEEEIRKEMMREDKVPF